MLRPLTSVSFLALASLLLGCAHAAPPAAPPPVVEAKPAMPPIVAAVTPGPGTVESLEPLPAACQLSSAELAQIHQLARVRQYLRAQVFPQWETAWPHLFLYGEHCQYILNYGDTPGDGFRLSPQKLEVAGFVTSQIFYRENAVNLPTGGKLPFFVPAQTLAIGERGRERWFVSGLYEVWRRDYNDSLQTYLGMFARELFHSDQERVPGLKGKGDNSLREALAKFCRQNEEFAKLVDEERSILMRAITETNSAKKKELTRQFLESQTKRRGRFFVAEKASWKHGESALQALDGSAEYMNFRVLTDCPEIPKDPRLSDDASKAFAACQRPGLGDVLRQVAFRPSYVQDLGVLQIILLNQVVPRWQDSLIRGESAISQLLTQYLGDSRVTR